MDVLMLLGPILAAGLLSLLAVKKGKASSPDRYSEGKKREEWLVASR